MSRKVGCNSTGEDVLEGTDLTGKTAVVTGDHEAADRARTSHQKPNIKSTCMPPVPQVPRHRLQQTPITAMQLHKHGCRSAAISCS